MALLPTTRFLPIPSRADAGTRQPPANPEGLAHPEGLASAALQRRADRAGYRRSATTGRLALLALLATGCATSTASTPAPQLEAGRRTVVRLVQFQSGQVLTLQNASSGTTNEVYSDDRSDPLTKVVRDDTLQSLLEYLAKQGMFARSSRVPAEAREALVVEHGGQRWAWGRMLPYSMAADHPEELTFHTTAQEFRATWDSATAFHTDRERPDFKGEKDRVRGMANDSQRKLESLQGLRQPAGPIQVPR